MLIQVRRLARLISVGLIASALCACATGAGNTQSAQNSQSAAAKAPLPGTSACFWMTNFDGSWTVLNQTQLLVYAPLTAPPYLVQLFQPVINLKFDQRLGFQDSERTGRICDKNFDNLVVTDFVPHLIPIVAVHQVTREQARALMIANGLKVRPEKASHG
jgi:hypothetical protein